MSALVLRARGARAVVGPDAPLPESRGRAVLVLAEAPDGSGALVSFDEVPDVLAVLPLEHLLPVEERLCLSADPRCCLLAPCEGCLAVLRAHLSDALSASRAPADGAAAFVGRWNELRASARAAAREAIAQAKRWRASAPQPASLSAGESVPSRAEGPEADPPTASSPQPPVEKKPSTRARRSRTQASPEAAGSESSPPRGSEPEAEGSPGAEVDAGPRGG